MAKNYSVDKVKTMTLRIRFSTVADPVSKSDEKGVLQYYAAIQKLHCFVYGDGSEDIAVEIEEKYYGAPKLTPWTAKQVGDAMKNYSNLNTAIYNDVKALYLDAINEDIS